MKLNDGIELNDSLCHGFVVMRDQNGNTIFKKHNMIVSSGRSAVFNMIKNKIRNSSTDSLPEFKEFTKIQFGCNNDATTLGHTSIKEITKLNGDVNDIFILNISNDNSNNDTPNTGSIVNVDIDDDARSIIFELSVTVTEPAEITELGLFFKDTSGSDSEKLFSRVTFDPIFCGPNAAITSLLLNYYIYL